MYPLCSAKKFRYEFLYVAALAIFIGFLALYTQWSDSELWAVSLAKTVFSFQNPSSDYKIFFNLILKSLYVLPVDNLGLIKSARITFAFIGIGVLLLSWKSTQYVSSNEKASHFFLILITTSPLFLSQSYKIRSDLLASLGQWISLFYFLYLKKENTEQQLSLKRHLIIVLLSLIPLFSTPKAIYGFFVNLIFIGSHLRAHTPCWLRRYLVSAFCVPILIFSFVALCKFAEFSTALDFFWHSYMESPLHPAFWTAESFQYVWQAILSHLPICFLNLFGFYLYLKKRDRELLPLLLACMASWAVIFIHNDRLPFFIFPHMIFPILFSAVALTHFQGKWLCKSTMALSTITALIFSGEILTKSSNEAQVDAQIKMQQYLARHKYPSYYDGTGVLPRQNSIYVFPAPQHLGNENEILSILDRPDISLIFWGNRLFYYLNPLYMALEERFFIKIGKDIFAKARVYRSNHTITNKEWKDIFSQLGNPQRIYLYEGENFLTMKLKNPEGYSCCENPPKTKVNSSFVAFCAFEPLFFHDSQSFHTLFDHKAY